jgi:hypothetical protein
MNTALTMSILVGVVMAIKTAWCIWMLFTGDDQ